MTLSKKALRDKKEIQQIMGRQSYRKDIQLPLRCEISVSQMKIQKIVLKL